MKWNLQPKDESKKDFVVPFFFFVLFFHSPPGSTGLEITPDNRPTAPSLSSRSIHLNNKKKRISFKSSI
jgi:hypothetical protein